MVTADRSDAVVSGLRELEAQARAEREAIASLEHEAMQPIELPNTDKIISRVFDLEARLRRAPAVARGPRFASVSIAFCRVVELTPR